MNTKGSHPPCNHVVTEVWNDDVIEWWLPTSLLLFIVYSFCLVLYCSTELFTLIWFKWYTLNKHNFTKCQLYFLKSWKRLKFNLNSWQMLISLHLGLKDDGEKVVYINIFHFLVKTYWSWITQKCILIGHNICSSFVWFPLIFSWGKSKKLWL